nr:MAG TPA: hypothetical protein [Caudoviricetes sp.]DAJ14584.1 MAG TPA: hypothetical protein [Siphoviridae sp. ctdzB12]
MIQRYSSSRSRPENMMSLPEIMKKIRSRKKKSMPVLQILARI